MSKVFLGGEVVRTQAPPSVSSFVTALAVPLTALGLVIGGVAIIDLVFAWLPARFGSAEWAFGVASRTFDSFGGVTMGLVFLTLAAGVRGSVWGLRLLSAAFGLFFLVLLVWAALFARNIPVALAAVPDAARQLLHLSIVRTALFAGLQIAVYGWLSWFTWRLAGATQQRG